MTDLDLQPGDHAVMAPPEFFCVVCKKPRPRRACSGCGAWCVEGAAARAGAVEGLDPAVAALPPAQIYRAERPPAAAGPSEPPAAPSAPPDGLQERAPASEPPPPPAAEEHTPTRNLRPLRRPRFPEEKKTMEQPAHYETDEAGRPLMRMQRTAAAQRANQSEIDRIREEGNLREADWTAMYCALLQGCATRDEVTRAAMLADDAYMEMVARLQGR